MDRLDEACTNAMIWWCLCNTAVATASWASMDLDGFLERRIVGKRAGVRAGSKQLPARCSRKNQDKFAVASMAKMLLHSWIGAHTRVHIHFLYRVCMYLQVLLCTMHLHVCTLDRCCEHQRTNLLHALYRMSYMIGVDIYTYIYAWAYVYICMYMYMYVRMCMYMYPCMYVCVCVCICIRIYVYACMQVYVYMHMCTCICVYVYVYIQVHMYFCGESACIDRCCWAPCMCRCVR